MPLRQLQLIIYHSPLFAAHWALFLPQPDSTNVGKRIHADGSPATGFEVLIEVEYSLEECTQSFEVIDLGEVEEDDVVQIARTIDAPTKSLLAISKLKPRHRVNIRNCQTWVTEVVKRLVEESVVSDTAIAQVESAPKN
ncbi:hypothetical protein B0J11DRAFT_602453 [Dendryphion nanum]|uniref:Uncharacterized protein n=1 Tax=Dendryphion nanum TaxID=256645 RepID=A0A9P9E3W8_9PLEO|nr:hypothetical protein B0J11DRAFT_602453 [Dendryphion nanum]